MTKTLNFSSGNVDSNDANSGLSPSIPADGAWHRVLTMNVANTRSEGRYDISTVGGVVNVRLTGATQSGQPHGLLQTDLAQVNRYVPLATLNGTGTINQPGDGSLLKVHIDPSAGEEIGFEFQQVSGTPAIRIRGSIQN